MARDDTIVPSGELAKAPVQSGEVVDWTKLQLELAAWPISGSFGNGSLALYFDGIKRAVLAALSTEATALPQGDGEAEERRCEHGIRWPWACDDYDPLAKPVSRSIKQQIADRLQHYTDCRYDKAPYGNLPGETCTCGRDDLIAALSPPITEQPQGWRPISELADLYQQPLWIASPKLIHGDANPLGIAEAYWQDIDGPEEGEWRTTAFDMCNDEWDTISLAKDDVTHFLTPHGPWSPEELAGLEPEYAALSPPIKRQPQGDN